VTKHRFPLTGDFIELHVLLKLLALAPSGGVAKAMIAEGLVTVDGTVEMRKGRKLRIGQRVRLGDDEIDIVGAS